jgi:hypothetical protein
MNYSINFKSEILLIIKDEWRISLKIETIQEELYKQR